MPFEKDGTYEKAEKHSQRFIIDDPTIATQLNQVEQRPFDDLEQDVTANLVSPTTDDRIDTVYAIDGSYREIEVGDGHRLGYILVSVVELTVADLFTGGSVSPEQMTDRTTTERVTCVLPGSGVSVKAEESLEDSVRRLFWEQLRDASVFDQNLYDVFTVLCREHDSGATDGISLDSCPTPACEASTTVTFRDQFEQTAFEDYCPQCQSYLYPTDAIDLYRHVKEYGSNERVYRAAMTALENLAVAAVTTHICQTGHREQTAVIKDGPLCQHTGGESWVSDSLVSYLQQYQHSGYPLVMGVKKHGQFNAHADQISDYLRPRHVLTLPNDYIYEYIRPTNSTSVYGAVTYYGKHFIYKTDHRHLYVFNLPRRESSARTVELAYEADEFPELGAAVTLLDTLHTPLLDGLIPLEIAHRSASISSKELVTHALRDFTTEYID